jgi:NTP pyrophosphatase (non-canonical NTP hydrolase)
VDKIPNRFDLIRSWANERGIYDKGNSHTQYVKLMEEAGELAAALLNNDKPEIVDAIGDIVVVLTNLAKLEGFDIENCVDSAYNEIANRTGIMHNGTFIKTGIKETL